MRTAYSKPKKARPNFNNTLDFSRPEKLKSFSGRTLFYGILYYIKYNKFTVILLSFFLLNDIIDNVLLQLPKFYGEIK